MLLATAPSCAGLVQYTDELRREKTGRSQFVLAPSAVGGITGFVLGVPVSIAASPVTYGVYRYEKSRAPLKADVASTMLFPSFVLWRAGILALGAPFDALEFALWRAWQEPVSLTPSELEEIERTYDRAVLSRYPVRPIYPDREWLERAAEAERGAAADGDAVADESNDRAPAPAAGAGH